MLRAKIVYDVYGPAGACADLASAQGYSEQAGADTGSRTWRRRRPCGASRRARAFPKPLGQQVIVENRPARLIGELAAKATPDGYTLMLASSTFLFAPLFEETSATMR